jgi:hypothetical protein
MKQASLLYQSRISVFPLGALSFGIRTEAAVHHLHSSLRRSAEAEHYLAHCHPYMPEATSVGLLLSLLEVDWNCQPIFFL